MVSLRLQRFYEWVPGGRKLLAVLSIEIRMFLYLNSLADHSGNISVFLSEDLGLINPYKLDCDCDLSYIGQIKRSIGVRVKDHISDIKNGHVSKSAMCEHTVDKPSHYIRID